LLKEGLHYRRDAFENGARANGFEVVSELNRPEPDDLLVVWNRQGHGHNVACKFDAVGARVIVAENGYMGKDWLGKTWYALSRDYHNGAGRTPNNGPERWQSIGFELSPMRQNTGRPVLLPQRGIGCAGVAMPSDWLTTAKAQHSSARIRLHPGQNKAVGVVDDCIDAAYVVTHGSGAGIKCMAAGIPCFTTWAKWIAASGCGFEDNRQKMFERLAWAMWTIEEVKNGKAIETMLAI
jgi:hypothetical protein